MLLVVAVLSAAGCKKQIDNAKAESSIKSGLETKGLKVEMVSCPTAKAAKKGDNFECTGKAGGKDFTVAVEQLDDDGNVNWKLKGYIVNSKDIVAQSGKLLPAGSTLICADRPVTVERGATTLDCELKNPDGKLQIVFAEDGSWKAVPVGGDEPKADEPKHDEPKPDDEKKE
jgi:hypothetical protein